MSLASIALTAMTSFASLINPIPVDIQQVYENQEVLESYYEQPITINFTGDILTSGGLENIINQNGVDYPFEKVSHILQDADITFGNLEQAVSLRGNPENKQFTFRSSPEKLQGLVNAGFDAVSLANNHTLDYGEEALLDTLDYLTQYGLGYAGAGRNTEEAFSPYVAEVRGKTVAIISASRVLPYVSWYSGENKPGIASAYQSEPLQSYIRDAVSKYDHTIVYIHWNKELRDYPESYAPIMAKTFIDLGVDAVIGGHSHNLMGMEIYKGKPIYYSIGNFVFTSRENHKNSETMIVTVELDGEETRSKIQPAKILKGQPNLMGEAYDQQIINKLNSLSYNVYVDNEGNVLEK